MTQPQVAPLAVALLLLLIIATVPVASYNRPFSRRQLVVEQRATNAFAAAGLVAFAAGWSLSDAESAIASRIPKPDDEPERIQSARAD